MKYPFAKIIPLGLILAGLLVACPPPVQPPATLILRPQATSQVGGVLVAVKSKIKFVATDDTGKVVDVTWDRNPAVGSIDALGEYTAPDTTPASPRVTIKATSKANPTDFGTLDIVIIAQGSAGISGNVTVDPSLLVVKNFAPDPVLRSTQARAINAAGIDWNAPHVKGSVLLVGANSRSRAASLRGVQVRNVNDTISSLSVPVGETEQAFAARVAQATGLLAQPEYIYRPLELPTPNDPNFATQDYLVQIDAQAGWAVQQTVTDNLVAVLDTGIKTDHEDLVGRFTAGKDFCATFNNLTCTEDIDPSELPPVDGAGKPIGNAGHGTASVGLIAATTNNALGVSGLTWGGKVLVVKVFGYDSNGAASPLTAVAKGITYAMSQGAKVINMSLGLTLAKGATDPAFDAVLADAASKGVVFVASAGNTNDANVGVYYPARNPNVIAVGSVNATNGISSFSAQGSQLALVAPGENILSTNFTATNTYAKLSGTSEAAPQVAAIAGLMLTKNPTLTSAQVRDILTSTARNLGAANTFGAGLVQAGAALRKATNPSAPPPAKSTVYVYADSYVGTNPTGNSPTCNRTDIDPTKWITTECYEPRGKVAVDFENAVGSATYTLTAKIGGFTNLDAGTYRIVACVNKNINGFACDPTGPDPQDKTKTIVGDLGGQTLGVIYDGTNPVTAPTITLKQL